MLRIRRRFAILMLCGAGTFLFIYLIINYTVPSGDKKPNFGALELKLQQLEDGLAMHGKEMRHLTNRLENTFQAHWKAAQQQENDEEKKTVLIEMFDNQRTSNDVVGPDESSVDLQHVPRPDIQMLDMYRNMSFADVDGGVWKQGWDIKYDPLQYNDHHKLKVFVVPHSHNDPGWLKTFDNYYEHDTKHILSNALRHLRDNQEMKFIWAEMSYFSRFYEDLGQNNKEEIKKLVQNRQLEFVSGGWVMPDEANSHWQNVLLQLTEGQTWLKKHLNITPISSWAIDPFGHSPTLPYILKKSGFQNHFIHRTHYSVKKELAQKRFLEFYWRQLWDDTGATELFTHMMPFYSYDVPHTCGPDPKICCQFDFKRMQGFGLSCPWRAAPQPITEVNVAARSELLVDQWKKKAELYRTNALIVPLGDDFRYSQSTEWDVQRINYEALFDHINGERKYFVEAKFGTLQEYFDAVHQQAKPQQFPTLSGDFFTYADRSDNYWSGYYTSRPYHKRMDRVLMHYVHSAEMLSAWNAWPATSKFEERLQMARRELSLFQHHDGVTGTAKTHVMQDYARRMFDAVKSCKFVMQQSVYRLLTKPTIYNADYNFDYFYLDDSHWPDTDDSRTTIILGDELPSKHVVFHNSLAQWREELVDFYVSSPYTSVSDFDGTPVQAQVSPVWSWHRHTLSNTITPQASTTKYRLLFKVKVPPLGLVTYVIRNEPVDVKPTYTSFATNLILTTTPISINLGTFPNEVNFAEHREMSLRVGNGPAVVFSADGLLKSIQLEPNTPHTPVHLKFLKYGTRISGDRSGAYLFLPNGPATPLVNIQPPVVLVQEGLLESAVTVGLPFVVHQTLLRGGAPEMRNLVDVGDMDDTEVVMRFSTHIESADTFYTDLNGLQIIKRKRFNKLPLQANFYPIPSALYIEDAQLRLTVVSAQPLGGSSLAAGELEIMQDRRLTHDDERGVGQGVLDNKPVWHIFRVLLERVEDCQKPLDTHPAGALTQAAYSASKSILSPLDKFIFAENDWLGVQASFGTEHAAVEDDVEIVVLRNLTPTKITGGVARDRKVMVQRTTGVIVHRTNLMQCANSERHPGLFNLKRLLQFGQNITAIYNTTLTFLQRSHKIDANVIHLGPMDTKAFVVRQRS